MTAMAENRVACEGACVAIAAYCIAETHSLCRAGVIAQAHIELVGRQVRGRKISPDTHIAATVGDRTASAYGLESAESGADLGDHTGYTVKFRLQSVEFAIEPSVAAGRDDVLVVNPVLVFISSLVSYICHCWTSS